MAHLYECLSRTDNFRFTVEFLMTILKKFFEEKRTYLYKWISKNSKFLIWKLKIHTIAIFISKRKLTEKADV